MSEWKNGYFLDYIELNPKVVLKKGDLYPFVDMASVDSITRIPISIELKQYTSGVKFQELDTVFARIEPCLQNGKRFLFKDFSSGFGSTEFLVFRAIKNKTTPLFVYYYMQTHRIKNIMINSMTGATGRQRVNNDVFNHLTVKIPSLSIQNRIAEILSRYDSLIENYQKQIKLLEESAQRLYKEWFVDLRFPGHENTKIVDGVPEGWEKKCVDDIYQIKYGKNLSTKLVTVKGNYPVYGANGIIGYYSKSNCHEQVVLITSRGNGSGDVSMTFHKESFITNNSFIVTPLEKYSYCKLAFTYHFLKHANFYSVRTGAAQPQLTNQSIHTVDVLLPMQQLIEAYCKLISPSIELIMELKGSMLYIVEARDRLLPKLMGGEIEV